MMDEILHTRFGQTLSLLIQLLGKFGEVIQKRDECPAVRTCKKLYKGSNDDRAVLVWCNILSELEDERDDGRS